MAMNEPYDSSMELLVKVAVCFRLGTMHHIGNAALKKPMMDMANIVNSHFDEDVSEVRLQCVKDCFFVNRQIISVDHEQAESIAMMRRVMRRLAVHEIAFRDRLDYEDMKVLISAFQQRIWHTQEDAHAEIHPKVALRILSRDQREKLIKRGDRRAELIQNFVMLALSVKDASASFDEQRPISVAGMRRAIQITYEAIDGYENLLVGLSRFTNPDGRSYFHAAGVAALVMLMCKTLDLPRQAVSELAIGAMLHDLARDALTDPFQGGKINEQTSLQAVSRIEHIPLRSLIRLSLGPAMPAELIRATMSYEVTQNLGESRIEVSLAARIIAVASAYQLLVAPIPPRRGLSPDRALALIFANPQRFDREVAELLAMSVGRMPIGTLLRLSNGSAAIVFQKSRDPDRPLVKPITASGEEEGAIIDLSVQTDIEISAVLDPIDENVNITRILIGDLSKEEIRDTADEQVASIALDEIEVDDDGVLSKPLDARDHSKPVLALRPIDVPEAEMIELTIDDIKISDIEKELGVPPPATDNVMNDLLQIDDIDEPDHAPLEPPPVLQMDALIPIDEADIAEDFIEPLDPPARLQSIDRLEVPADIFAVSAPAEPSIDLLFEDPTELKSATTDDASPSPIEAPLRLPTSAVEVIDVRSAEASIQEHEADQAPMRLPTTAVQIVDVQIEASSTPDAGLNATAMRLPTSAVEVLELKTENVATTYNIPAPPPSLALQIDDIEFQDADQIGGEDLVIENIEAEPPPLVEPEVPEEPIPPVLPRANSWDEMPKLTTIAAPAPPPQDDELQAPESNPAALIIDLELD